MTRRPEPAAATWLQAALFGCAALGFGLTSRANCRRTLMPGLPTQSVIHFAIGRRQVTMTNCNEQSVIS
jgi:hypothetical protein